MRSQWKPDISVIIATRERPQLLRRAAASVLAQQGIGRIELIIVFDGCPIDEVLDLDEGRHTVRVMSNRRASGLAGARNTGISEARGRYVAFCDDDDEWKPGKLHRQLAAFADPSVSLCATGIEIHSAGGVHQRIGPREVVFDDLLRSRITELHPSSFLIPASLLRREIGLVDEAIPASYGEDYDLLLRAARSGKVVSVPEPLTIIHWDRTSFFTEKWQGIANGLRYLLEKHPEFLRDRTGTARIQGQIAFAYGAQGARGEARTWARRALAHNLFQPRAYLALLVGLRLLSGEGVVAALNRRGRGV